jgi:hypothetical protein
LPALDGEADAGTVNRTGDGAERYSTMGYKTVAR